jgi:hypothetical protein
MRNLIVIFIMCLACIAIAAVDVHAAATGSQRSNGSCTLTVPVTAEIVPSREVSVKHPFSAAVAKTGKFASKISAIARAATAPVRLIAKHKPIRKAIRAVAPGCRHCRE